MPRNHTTQNPPTQHVNRRRCGGSSGGGGCGDSGDGHRGGGGRRVVAGCRGGCARITGPSPSISRRSRQCHAFAKCCCHCCRLCWGHAVFSRARSRNSPPQIAHASLLAPLLLLQEDLSPAKRQRLGGESAVGAMGIGIAAGMPALSVHNPRCPLPRTTLPKPHRPPLNRLLLSAPQQ